MLWSGNVVEHLSQAESASMGFYEIALITVEWICLNVVVKPQQEVRKVIKPLIWQNQTFQVASRMFYQQWVSEIFANHGMDQFEILSFVPSKSKGGGRLSEHLTQKCWLLHDTAFVFSVRLSNTTMLLGWSVFLTIVVSLNFLFTAIYHSFFKKGFWQTYSLSPGFKH